MHRARDFAAATSAALKAGYSARLAEYKARAPLVHRQHIARFAELYKELHVRAKNRSVVRSKNVEALAAQRREQLMAIECENREEAERSKCAAGKLLVAIATANAELETLRHEVAELERCARLSYEVLEQLGEPAQPSFAALVAGIHAKLCREEKLRLDREVAHMRAGQTEALADLLQQRRAVEQSLALYILDAGAEAVALEENGGGGKYKSSDGTARPVARQGLSTLEL